MCAFGVFAACSDRANAKHRGLTNDPYPHVCPAGSPSGRIEQRIGDSS